MDYSCRILSNLKSFWLIMSLVQSVQSDNAINQTTRKMDTEFLINMVESLQNDVQDQREIINAQKIAINALEATVKQQASNQQMSDMEYQHTRFGCLSDVLTLTCHDNRLINVTKAYYGMYFFPCDSGCCAPHPTSDCSELVEVNRPADWLAILASCNGQESCTYENRGSPIDECQEGYLADWLQIFYQCTPVPVNDPVGFSAHAGSNSISYIDGEVVMYPNVDTNLGGYYNSATSVFLCPANGVYIFAIHGHNAQNDNWYSYIMLDDTTRLVAHAYNTVNRGHTGATLITECNAGEQVWIMGQGTMYGYRGSHFTGYLLHRY